jgi:DNA-directed RNA polymerase subunit RPC12/RpoP
MFAQITCPICQSKTSIPEGDMGKRQVCPNCKSPFFAGTSITEPQVAGKPASAPDSAYQKTMLGDTAPAIKYNCPRCQAPLEAPSIEAGTKKPCPKCGQRLQVPAAPPPAAGQPGLNKTLLASDARSPAAPPIKYNCPTCNKLLESPASEAGIKKPCPACGQRLQVPAAPLQPNPNRTLLASDANKPQPIGGQPGYAMPGTAPGAPPTAPGGQITIGSYTMSTRTFALSAVGIILLLLIVPAVIRGGKTEDVAALKKEIEKANAEVDLKKADAERMNRLESETRAKLTEQENRMLQNQRDALNAISNEKQRAELMAKFEADKRDSERKQDKLLAEIKAQADASKAALDAAQMRQQTIINAPPPVYYYPPYHPRYYWPY